MAIPCLFSNRCRGIANYRFEAETDGIKVLSTQAKRPRRHAAGEMSCALSLLRPFLAAESTCTTLSVAFMSAQEEKSGPGLAG